MLCSAFPAWLEAGQAGYKDKRTELNSVLALLPVLARTGETASTAAGVRCLLPAHAAPQLTQSINQVNWESFTNKQNKRQRSMVL